MVSYPTDTTLTSVMIMMNAIVSEIRTCLNLGVVTGREILYDTVSGFPIVYGDVG